MCADLKVKLGRYPGGILALKLLWPARIGGVGEALMSIRHCTRIWKAGREGDEKVGHATERRPSAIAVIWALRRPGFACATGAPGHLWPLDGHIDPVAEVLHEQHAAAQS